MFAKLFDNISPRNLLNALLFLFLLGLSFWIYPSDTTIWFPIRNWSWPPLKPIGAFSLFTVVALASALLSSEAINRKHVFPGQYISLLIAGTLIWIWLYPLKAGSEIWSLFLFGFLIFYLLPLLEPKANHPLRSYGSGLAIALAGFIHANSIFLLILPLGLSLAMRSFSGRTVLALILGYGTNIYFAFTLDHFLDTQLLELWWNKISSLSFFSFNGELNRLIPLILLALLLGLSILINLSNGNLYNNEQRQLVNYWIFFTLVAVMGFLLFENGNFWLGLLIFPSSSLASLAIKQVNNRWLKDGLLLLPFLAYLSFFFT